MKINQISKPVTAKSLNESLAKKFGKRIALEKFTLEQLQDARNKLRTQLRKVETNESFSSVQKEAYQKSKLFLDILNAEIAERNHIHEDQHQKRRFSDFEDGGDDYVLHYKDESGAKHKVPFALSDDGYPTVDDFVADFRHNHPSAVVLGVEPESPDEPTESVIREGAEEQAEIVMASKNMVDKITGWLEDTAEMQTESMLELADAIRDEMGSEKSEAFVEGVRSALEALYTTLEQTRTSMSNSLGILTGEQEAADMMGDEEPDMEPIDDADAEVDVGDEAPEGAVDADDEFAADDAAAGGEEEAGRPRRESIEFSRRLGIMLSSKKK